MPMDDGPVRVAAVADLHCNKNNRDILHAFFESITPMTDIILLCGDLSDTGLIEEAHFLAEELQKTVTVPMIGVLGNHDYESGNEEEIRHIIRDAGVTLLDGESCEIHGIGFAGIKGFCGGFGRYQLEAWGEQTIKHFVNEALEESMKLEIALARLRNEPRIVLMHYAPIRATVEGESPEIYPFLGSSRLEEPLNWYDVNVVFHGHAHSGSLEGHTTQNVPVYNVALPLLYKTYPDRPPFRLMDIPRGMT